jgi:hypothetical protein
MTQLLPSRVTVQLTFIILFRFVQSQFLTAVRAQASGPPDLLIESDSNAFP